ncbi:putative Dresden prostate carcinoma protein 2 [Plecturocebus cupreus]
MESHLKVEQKEVKAEGRRTPTAEPAGDGFSFLLQALGSQQIRGEKDSRGYQILHALRPRIQHLCPATVTTNPKRKAEGDTKRDKTKRTAHREDLRGCLLNLLLQSQSPGPKKTLPRRERRDSKGRWEKLTRARRIALQKMPLPKQSRHRRLKAQGVPSGVCAFRVTVYL